MEASGVVGIGLFLLTVMLLFLVTGMRLGSLYLFEAAMVIAVITAAITTTTIIVITLVAHVVAQRTTRATTGR